MNAADEDKKHARLAAARRINHERKPAMKPETKMARILASDASPQLKILKLQNLALRCIASSPIQKQVIAAYKELQSSTTKG